MIKTTGSRRKPKRRSQILLACGLTALLASAAQAVVIDFESDAPGSVANGFASAGSPFVQFSDSMGSDLEIGDFGSQGDGQSLAVLSDDASELVIDLNYIATSISLDFGNDDPGYSNPGDTAVLTVFLAGVQVGQSVVVLNRDDIMNQTISVSGVKFDRATFIFNVTTSGLIEIVDNIDISLSPCLNLGNQPPGNPWPSVKSGLTLKQGATADKDKWAFKWIKGSPTTPADFADPTVSARYALCIYDGLGVPIAIANVPPSGTLWTATAHGYQYNDPAGSADGIQKIILKASASGKSKVIVKGKGANLPDPVLGSLSGPVLALLANSDTDFWFFGYETTVVSNTATLFKGKAP